MKTYTITIDENIISLEAILEAAWRNRLDYWANEYDRKNDFEEAGRRAPIAEARIERIEKQMTEINRILNQIKEQ